MLNLNFKFFVRWYTNCSLCVWGTRMRLMIKFYFIGRDEDLVYIFDTFVIALNTLDSTLDLFDLQICIDA